MRKALIGGIVAALGLSTLALAPSASASDLVIKVTRTNSPEQPPKLGPSLCGFPIDITVVKNKETAIETVVTKKDGTPVSDTTLTSGPLVLTFTNHNDTSKSFTRDLSGTTLDVTKGLNDTFVGTGNNWEGIGPTGQVKTGEPGLVISHGLIKLTITIDPGPPPVGTVQTFSVHGTQENGCALLS